MAYLIDHFLDRSTQFFVFATLAPQDFFLHNRQNHCVKMIMVNLFSQFLGCGYIDFISVHYCRYYIISTEFFFNEMIGFFIKLLCVFIATVTLEVHRVHINHNLIKQRCVFPQPSKRYHTVCFHLL